MPTPFIRLGCCSCKLVNQCSLWKLLSIKSLAYTTTTTQVSSHSSSSDTSSHPIGKARKFNVIDECQWKRERMSASLLFVRQLKESGFKHDVDTYMSIVRLLLLCDLGMNNVRLHHLFMYIIQNKNRDFVGFEISDLLEALIEEKLIKAIEVLVELYASVGRCKEAIHSLSKIKTTRVSTPICNFVLNEMVEWGELDMLWKAYRELERRNGLIPNVHTFGILVKGLCRNGRVKEAWDHVISLLMPDAGVEPDAFIYGTYIHELCSKRRTDQAFQLVKNLREDSNSNNLVDVYAYACVIRGFVQESRLQDAQHVLLHDMKNTQVVPDADCYGALFQGYFQKADTAKVLDLSKEMETRFGVNKARNVFVRCIMQSLGHGEAQCKFKGFMESGVFVVDGETFNMGIDAACKLGKMEDAMGLVQEWMKGGEMKLWEMHYRTLIDGYCLNGEPWNALCMFKEMIRNGLRPDSTTYHVLARGFQECGVSLPLYMLFKKV